MKEYGPWKIVGTSEVYRDPWLTVRKDDVIRPDGQPGTYSVATLLPGVSVLAMDQQGNVYLTEEFHYAVGRVTLEAVSGGVEAPETPLASARRELAEEVGIAAESWTHLGTVDPFTGSVCSPTQLYLAQDLTFGPHAQEGTETIRCVKLSLKEAYRKVEDGEITHAPSCLLILKAWIRFGAGWHN